MANCCLLRRASASSVSISSSRSAAYRIVPPGVSYTPRLFMPTTRVSTMSARPMPFAAPSSLSLSTSSTGPCRTPSTATGMPRSNSTVTSCSRSGASAGDTERWNSVSLRSPPGVLQVPAFVAEVPDVVVARIDVDP